MASPLKTKTKRKSGNDSPKSSVQSTPPSKPVPRDDIHPAGPALDPDFAKVVAESKAAIAAEGQKEVRKRGRPPGSTNKPSEGSPQAPQALGPAAPPALSVYLKGPLMALSSIPAGRHKIPELALTEEEAVSCAQSLDACLQAFIPDLNNMSPKTAAILGVCLTVGSIGFNKYAIYSGVMEERREKIAVEQAASMPELPKDAPKPEPRVQTPNMDAARYFDQVNQ